VAATILQYYGTGRRKRAVARVFLRPGSGGFQVNGRKLDEYFTMVGARIQARQPLMATETAEKFDVLVTVEGGGIAGQGGAVRLGVARALIEFNSELRPKLKELGFLTRDAREHERKKYGQRGARRRFQFSKR
jgi:small subunit ribosomal protein S9